MDIIEDDKSKYPIQIWLIWKNQMIGFILSNKFCLIIFSVSLAVAGEISDCEWRGILFFQKIGKLDIGFRFY